MKTNVFQLGVLSIAIVFVLIACETKKPEGVDASVTQATKEAPETKEPTAPAGPPERSYILLSNLAFKGYLASPQPKMPEVKALYSAAQKDTREIASVSQNKEVKDQKADKNYVMLRKSVDLCPCSTGSGLCPCPGDTTDVALAARTYNEVKVNYDGEALKSSSNINGDNSWVVFKWPAELKNGKHKLTITGKFTDKMQKYEVPVEVKDGKFYLKWE